MHSIKYNIKCHQNTNILIDSDKSITHRALIFSAIAKGTSYIDNPLLSKDTMATLNAITLLGVQCNIMNNCIIIHSPGLKELQALHSNKEDYIAINMENAGTGCRLIIALAFGVGAKVRITGDDSLSSRSMLSVIQILESMGAVITSNNGYLPIKISGQQNNSSAHYSFTPDKPSAQLKGACIIASLCLGIDCTYKESYQTRNHTEKFLELHNVNKVSNISDTEHSLKISGPYNIHRYKYDIPGDISSALFVIASVILREDVRVRLNQINYNDSRNWAIKALIDCSANILPINKQLIQGEDVVDLLVKSSSLKTIYIHESKGHSIIDEIPMLAMLYSLVDGVSTFCGIDSLKAKECNRIDAILYNLSQLGIKARYMHDNGGTIELQGNSKIKINNKHISFKSYDDHRITMSCLICASYLSSSDIYIDNIESINISMPNFFKVLNQVGIIFNIQ